MEEKKNVSIARRCCLFLNFIKIEIDQTGAMSCAKYVARPCSGKHLPSSANQTSRMYLLRNYLTN